MKDPTTGARVFGRTRWRRFGLLLGPSVGVVVVLFYLIASGVIAVSFSMSGIPFTLNADNLSGNGFVQYATIDTITNTTASGLLPPGSALGTKVADTVTVIHDGTITNLDQTVCVPTGTALGSLLVEIKAGDPQVTSSQVTFSTLVANAPLLTAKSATFSNIDIGRDAQDAINHYVPASGITGLGGLFSQSADTVSIDGLKQVAIGTSAGSFTLPGLTLGASFVTKCP